jgi:hypothetical protein
MHKTGSPDFAIPSTLRQRADKMVSVKRRRLQATKENERGNKAITAKSFL